MLKERLIRRNSISLCRKNLDVRDRSIGLVCGNVAHVLDDSHSIRHSAEDGVLAYAIAEYRAKIPSSQGVGANVMKN